ncbi:hypothetical protein ENSA5_69430 [Enhygromyxa salina]|uniref:Tetratricopeptide repeat protein n=1 Tax=Enhygromyxa salina TaxID=215803 RepID=A0A2S9XB26_9BACT|nr:hypothetical protein ENSA5_69430 [Enhygromyxa salina]
MVPGQIAAAQPAQAQPAQARRKLPRVLLFVGAGVLAVLVIIAAIPSETSEQLVSADDSRATSGEGTGSDAAAPSPDEAVYLDIDRLLSAKDTDAALELIRRTRDEFPSDSGLLWREGRALALAGGEANRVTALHRYAEAAGSDPALAARTEFEAELRNLLRDKKLRETAIDVAVRRLGGLGHTFLLEVINDTQAELAYVTRHRIIDELQHEPAMVARIDLRRHLALDLSQAGDSPTPCAAFASALDTIAAGDDPYFVDALMTKALVAPAAPGVGEDASACAGLDAKLEQVRAQFRTNHPKAAAKAERSSSKKKKRKKRGGFRLPF